MPPPSWWSAAHAEGRAWYALMVDGRGMQPRTTGDEEEDTPLRDRYLAQRGLERRGYATYVPSEVWTKRRSRFSKVRIKKIKPLIPGLLFAHLPLAPNWYDIQSAPFVRGVYGLVRPISDLDYQRIRAMERAARANPADPYVLRKGDRAEIEHGPMTGARLEITDMLVDIPEPVARGLVEVFGGRVEIVVPLADLKAIRV